MPVIAAQIFIAERRFVRNYRTESDGPAGAAGGAGAVDKTPPPQRLQILPPLQYYFHRLCALATLLQAIRAIDPWGYFGIFSVKSCVAPFQDTAGTE